MFKGNVTCVAVLVLELISVMEGSNAAHPTDVSGQTTLLIVTPRRELRLTVDVIADPLMDTLLPHYITSLLITNISSLLWCIPARV